MEPVELQFFPSCYECLSWSADGELAVAAGEYVHILTPSTYRQDGSGPTSTGTAGPWQFARLRANVFTIKEWPTINPQNRDNFSIGAEQSISTVASLAWSPPGLAKYKRCVLAVLTTNLLLSLYDAGGLQRKWSRVTIVNDVLNSYFAELTDDKGLRARKARIRSFAWCPPLKAPVERGDGSSGLLSPFESRWGMQVLAVANDAGDVVFLQVRRAPRGWTSENPYSIKVLSAISFPDLEDNFSMIHTPSLFAAAMKPKARISYVACGPWTYQSSDDSDGKSSAKSAVAFVCGEKLEMISLNVNIVPPEDSSRLGSEFSLELQSIRHPAMVSNKKLNSHQYTGPLKWIFEDTLDSISVSCGIFTGMVTITMSKAAYGGKSRGLQGTVLRERLFFQDPIPGHSAEDGHEKCRHWEPIGAITPSFDTSTGTSRLHLGTLAAYAESYTCPTVRKEAEAFQAPWKKRLEDFRERFDIDRDLGGLAVARIWGMDSCRGLIAVAFTLHPGDMVEYSTAAEERTTLIVSSGSPDGEPDDAASLLRIAPNRTRKHIEERRKVVLDFILGFETENQYNDPWSRKLLYAAAICTITSCRDNRLLSFAHSVLEKLEAFSGADLADEKSKCSSQAPSQTISPKSAAQLTGPGGEIFEKCDICDTGIEWYSASEAQCAEGHLFARCGLTFLCIPEPGISKFCSVCETEYLNSEVFGPTKEAEEEPLSLSKYLLVFEAFDTCVYCEGKFHD